jgi:hypothetical protein
LLDEGTNKSPFAILQRYGKQVAEGVGFEPTDELPHLLISSQVPLTTQPPFRTVDSIRFSELFSEAKLAFAACIHASGYRRPKNPA